MSVDTGSDGQAKQASPVGDVRPIVAGSGKSFAVPLFIAGTAIVAIMLFTALDANRRGLAAPATLRPAEILTEVGSRVPLLYIPPERQEEPPLPIVPIEEEGIVDFPAPAPPFMDEPVFDRSSTLEPNPFPEQPSIAPARPPGAVLVYDRSGGGARSAAGAADQPGAQATIPGSDTANQRVRAGRLSNPSTTVIQGTVIPAVLETAIDTNRGGPARAIVSRNVFGFDGTRVLIPRGSRLIGQYGTSLTAGQNRVLVEWTRLVRPDGATIALDSPSADRLGRPGIRGDVNSHFWERFASAIFRTSLDVGAALATQQIGNGAFVVLPQTLRESGSSNATTPEVQRTLSVDQGVAVSVFVARDLDFTPVERGR
ncbi:TrbI/VirB10 family protein [Parasphingopyxis lamellibrachiae]|uniref:Type IV secretion system protein VirB10 n=1 Tax=Parasphingopyxis lamellibrachiae TaxID=680125 RepID=A0A3D9F842_9SPHN|nr:TrbI/VirB10 family protein [Parasphingopyxis lamellibrachiae]RED12669.1 type IV secretion system protein VirB10 [Parasphingopyxis lamellibrachiae]